ncbi:MAG TPA: hypothetical protein DCZ94_21560 [Lentisphaeria bacterium]|nr:MAG: hypothetical protein A2X48_14490 [Lentisphaerae bacterium GWF2_49_21]HBC89533.1 hypothetical protein [Lentisphaeria bacterium]
MSQLSVDASINAQIYRGASTYADARTGAGLNLSTLDADVATVVGQVELASVVQFEVYRSFLYFNTAGITNNAIITGVTLNIYGHSTSLGMGDFNITVQNGQPTYPHDTPELGDFLYTNYQYSSNGGLLTTAGFNTAGYNGIPLNSNGISWINKTGITRLCLRSSKDITGTTPSANTDDYIMFKTIYAGELYLPYLLIDFEAIPAVPASLSIKF